MRLKVTPHLAIEDVDSEVIEIVAMLSKRPWSDPLPKFLDPDIGADLDWFFVTIEPKKEQPHGEAISPDGTFVHHLTFWESVR